MNGELFDPWSTRGFNRICRVLALLWLVVALPVSFWRSPTYQDFSGIYSGALAARLGAWKELYPLPVGTGYYIGEDNHHREKAGWTGIADRYQISDREAFLNPPWQALALLPLAYMSYRKAHAAWVGANIAGMWVIAWAAGRSLEICLGKPSRGAGLITLLCACSILAYRAIRVGNMSPLIGLCLVAIIWHLMGRLDATGFLGGLAAAWGALAKLATAALFPLAVVMGRWKIVAWALVLFALDVLITWCLAGAATFREFFTVIAPSLARSSINPGNKSLQGLLLRLTGQTPLPSAISIAFRLLQGISLAVILWLLVRRWPKRSHNFWLDPAHVFAAAVALIGWLLIFSPLCWEHYFVYLCPFWGWLIWEGMQSRGRAVAVAAALAMNWLPLPVLRWLKVPEPFNSYMLYGLMIMVAIALMRLWPRSSQTADGLGVPQT